MYLSSLKVLRPGCILGSCYRYSEYRIDGLIERFISLEGLTQELKREINQFLKSHAGDWGIFELGQGGTTSKYKARTLPLGKKIIRTATLYDIDKGQLTTKDLGLSEGNLLIFNYLEQEEGMTPYFITPGTDTTTNLLLLYYGFDKVLLANHRTIRTLVDSVFMNKYVAKYGDFAAIKLTLEAFQSNGVTTL